MRKQSRPHGFQVYASVEDYLKAEREENSISGESSAFLTLHLSWPILKDIWELPEVKDETIESGIVIDWEEAAYKDDRGEVSGTTERASMFTG